MVLVGVIVGVIDIVEVTVGVTLIDIVGVIVGVILKLFVTLGVAETDSDGVGVIDAVSLGVIEGVSDGVNDNDGVVLGVGGYPQQKSLTPSVQQPSSIEQHQSPQQML